MSLDRVSIGIKTFLRDGKLFKAIDGIRRTMPEAQMIIADDGEMTEEKDGIYADLVRDGHKIILLDFDAGFGKKSNAIAAALGREFLLVGSDDFDFSPNGCRVGIEKMLAVLDQVPNLAVASGRVDNQPYEMSFAEVNFGVYEIPCNFDAYPPIVVAGTCDLTKNYSLIRRSVFWAERWDTDEGGPFYYPVRTSIGWDDNVKIGGGEHAAFFLDLKRAGHQVAFVPEVNINAQEGDDSFRYNMYRRRACRPERECFKKRGIKKYVLADGTIDYEEKV